MYAYRYYNDKNVYPSTLPITPLTKLVTDDSLVNSLYKRAADKMKYPVTLHLVSVYETALPRSSGVLYDLRFRNDINEEYFALIESL